MARRNSRFVNQKIIIGNKSVQASDLTDSAKTELASDSDFVKSVVGYNSLNLTNTDQLLTTAGALSDAGLLRASLSNHESLLNGLNRSIQTRGDSYAKDDEFINVIQTEEFSTHSDYYLVLDVPQSYIDLQAIRHDSHVAAGTLDSWRQNDFLDSFWIDNVVTNNRKVWYDSAGNNSKILKYKLHSVTVEMENLHKFFGTRAGIDSDTVIRFQILDSAKSTDAGAFLAQDDSNNSGYYTVLDSITAPLSETILNREFNIPANLAFHKGSQDSFEVTYLPRGTLTLPEALVNRDTFFRGGSPYKPLQGSKVSAHRVRKIRSAFRFKTTLSDNLVAEPVWSRVSPKFKYVIPKPGKLYNVGTAYGETAGAYHNRRAYFPFASETFISAPTVTGSQSALDTKVYGINYGNTNANYWPYSSFATLATPLAGNYPEPQYHPNQKGTSGSTYGVMQGGFPFAVSRSAYGVNFTTFNKTGVPAIPASPANGQYSHGSQSAPEKGYYLGGGNVGESTTKRAVWNYTTHSWSNTTPMGYGHGPYAVGVNHAFGMSNDTHGHYGGGTGTYSTYIPLSNGYVFPHSNDASLTGANLVAGRALSNVTGNNTSWYMWDGYSNPAPTFVAQSNRWKTTFTSGSWTSLPTALSDAGQGPSGTGDGHWW